MADALTIKDVLAAVQQTDRTVGSLVGHVKASTAASERVAEGVERLTDAISSDRQMAGFRKVDNGKGNGIAYALLTMIGGIALILLFAVTTLQEGIANEKADRLIQGNSIEKLSASRTESINTASQVRHNEAIASSIAGDKELRDQINRVERYFDAMVQDKMRQLGNMIDGNSDTRDVGTDREP